MICKFCGKMIDDNAIACPHCRRELRVCTHCGVAVDANARVCPHCRGNLTGQEGAYGNDGVPDSLALGGFVVAFILPAIGFFTSIGAYRRIKKEGGSREKFAKAGIAVGLAMQIVWAIVLVILRRI